MNVAPVQGGKFAGEAPAGTCRVEILAYKVEQIDPNTPGYTPEGSKTNYIPAQYNQNSTLTAEVKQGGTNDFKFEITSK